MKSKIPKAFHHGLRPILEVPSNRCGSHLVFGSSPLSRSSKSKAVETKPTKGLPVMIEPRGCTQYHDRFASGQEKSVVLTLAEKCGLLSSVWLVGIVKGADLVSRHCSVFHLLLLRVFMFSHDVSHQAFDDNICSNPFCSHPSHPSLVWGLVQIWLQILKYPWWAGSAPGDWSYLGGLQWFDVDLLSWIHPCQECPKLELSFQTQDTEGEKRASGTPDAWTPKTRHVCELWFKPFKQQDSYS